MPNGNIGNTAQINILAGAIFHSYVQYAACGNTDRVTAPISSTLTVVTVVVAGTVRGTAAEWGCSAKTHMERSAADRRVRSVKDHCLPLCKLDAGNFAPGSPLSALCAFAAQ